MINVFQINMAVASSKLCGIVYEHDGSIQHTDGFRRPKRDDQQGTISGEVNNNQHHCQWPAETGQNNQTGQHDADEIEDYSHWCRNCPQTQLICSKINVTVNNFQHKLF